MKIIKILLVTLALCSCAEERAEYYFDKGLWAVNEDKYRDAITNYRKAIGILPSHNEARLNLGGLLVQLGEFDEAKFHFRYVIQNTPKNTDAYAYMGLVYRKEKNFSMAEEMYKQALKIDSMVPVQWELGIVLLELKKFEEAQIALEKEKNLMSNLYKNYHLALAKALRGQGKIKEAEDQEQLANQLKHNAE